MRRKWIFIAPVAILGMTLVAFIGGEVVKQLWNWLLPALFGWPALTFWQALGILALCRILFGGVGGRGFRRGGRRRRLAEHWKHMTPEQRERLRHGMGRHWGFVPPEGESKGE
jgi:hypothetical protein